MNPRSVSVSAIAFLTLAPLASMLAQAASPSAGSPGAPVKAGEEVVSLSVFTVSTDRPDPYRTTDSLSAARIRGAIIDTPATINVLTSQFFEDIGAHSIFDATQYVSGIGNGRLAGPNGILDRQTIRGFENDGRTIDNFSSGFQANLNPLLIDRVEIVKGPNAILSPTGAPGGSLNVLTKSPLFKQQSTVAVELGSYFAQRLLFDTTGPLPGNPRAAFRVIGSFQDAKTYVPGKLKQWDINPQFTYRLSDRSQVSLKYTYSDWESSGAASNPGTVWIAGPDVTDGATVPNTPPPGFRYRANNGVPEWAARQDKVHRFAGEFTTELSPNLSMRLGAEKLYDYFKIDGGQAAFPNINAAHYEPATGRYTPNLAWARNAAGTFVSSPSPQYDPTNVARTAQLNPSWTEDMQIQNDYAGRFTVGAVTLQPIVGGVYQRAKNNNYNRTAALAPVNLFAPDNNPARPAAYNLSTSAASRTTQKQLYTAVRSGFLADRLLLTGGASRVWLETKATNRLTNVVSPLKGSKDSYLGGVLAKPAKNMAVYYSYSTNAALVSFNNTPLFREGKQHEVGAKTELFDQRLSISGAWFKITQTNLVTPNPLFLSDPVRNPQNTLSDQNNKGYEFDVVGGLTKELSVVASYTRMKLREPRGRRLRNIPDELANLLLRFQFPKGRLQGVGVFAGVNHVGNAAGESATGLTALGELQQVSFFVPSRTIWNVGGSYVRQNWRFNLNVDNVLDKKTPWQSSGRNSLSPFPGINPRLTTTFSF